MPTLITSQELLAEVGISIEDKPAIPTCYRHLLITSVITLVSAEKLKTVINNHGDQVSLREVFAWQKATRSWLGLPVAGRGKPTDEYRKKVKKWLQENGAPTLEDIDAGWVPVHRRANDTVKTPKLSANHQKIIEELRMQMKALNAAKDDDEVKQLLAKYLSSF
jgi:hypothetical protein